MADTPSSSPPTCFRITDDDGGANFLAFQRLADALLPPARLKALLDRVGGSPLEALRVPAADLRGADLGFTERQAARLAEAAGAPLPPRFQERAETLGVCGITWRDPAYPAGLVPLDDAPPMLFVRGALRPEDRFAVAIVGSRRATAYGKEQAEAFAADFARHGLMVVSGGAAGIDTAAHQGALGVGGRTVAVLGCGVDITYPAENRALFERVARGGAVVSEFSLGTRPEPWRFPTRNRIIAGMARAVVLVETPEASGALGTARCAAEYGRDVWVVPGPVNTGRSRGGHQLVQDGASLADRPEDVLSSLGIVPKAATDRDRAAAAVQLGAAAPPPVAASAPAPAAPPLPEPEAKLLAEFDLIPKHLDEAASRAGLIASQAAVTATLLEMKGLIRRQPGNLFVRTL
jgi:DNA protecting protein DprA